MVLEPGVRVLVAIIPMPRASTPSSARSSFLRCRVCVATGRLLKEKIPLSRIEYFVNAIMC